MSRLAGTLVLAGGLLAPAHLFAADVRLDPIIGVWRIESAVVGDSKILPDAMKSAQVLIGPEVIAFRMGAISTARYSLDRSRRPATIDFWSDHDLTLGIYQLDGEKLKLHLGGPGAERPTAFDPNLVAPADMLLGLVRVPGAEVPTPPPENRLLPSRTTGRPLWLIQPDGSGLKLLMAMSEYLDTGSPEWSRDASHVACDAWRSGKGENYVKAHVFTIRADGQDLKDLGPGAMPSWSPDGRRIAMSQYSPFHGVWIMNADGSGREPIDRAGWGTDWSPCKNEIVYSTYEPGANLCVYDADGKTTRELLRTPYQRIWWAFSWSPDGQQVAFKGIDPDGKTVIAVVEAQGKPLEPRVVLDDPKVVGSAGPNLSWDAAGKGILVSARAAGEKAVQIYRLDPLARNRLTRIGGDVSASPRLSPAWSPKGDRIVFCGSRQIP